MVWAVAIEIVNTAARATAIQVEVKGMLCGDRLDVDAAIVPVQLQCRDPKMNVETHIESGARLKKTTV